MSKLLSWDVGKIDASKLPNLRGSVNLVTGATPEPTNPSIRWCTYYLATIRLCSFYSHPWFQRSICHQPVGSEWLEGEPTGHVRGEVQALQGGEVPDQGGQVPGSDVIEVNSPGRRVDLNCDYPPWYMNSFICSLYISRLFPTNMEFIFIFLTYNELFCSDLKHLHIS